jgi:hypothetical protein
MAFSQRIVNRSRKLSGLAMSHRPVIRHAWLLTSLLTQPLKTLARWH